MYPCHVWLQSPLSVSVSYSFVSVGRFQCRDAGMEIYCCKCNFISSFFSTALMMVITGSCPAVVPLLPSPFKKAVTCAAQCQIHGSWLKYCLDTDKKGVKPFPNDLLSWLCSCITVSYRMAQWFNACDGKSGNPTEWQFPSVSSSLLALYWFTTSKSKCITCTEKDKKIHFLHLKSFIELYPICQCLFDVQIQVFEIPLISNNENTHCLSYRNRSSSLLIQGNTHLADYMLGPLQYLQQPYFQRSQSTRLKIHTQCLWLW